jgi:hypothetical protein
MDFLGGNTVLVLDPGPKLYFAALAGLCGAGFLFTKVSRARRASSTSPIIRARDAAEGGDVGDGEDGTGAETGSPGVIRAALLFAYACFFKPHAADKGRKPSQQDALESFYSSQAGAYDATRGTLLRGREDMLALVAAQLRFKAAQAEANPKNGKEKRIWVDVRHRPDWISV